MTWDPVDLEPIVAGGVVDLPPTMLARTDGVALLYPDRTNVIAGESEGMKTWLVLLAAAEQLAVGSAVLYLDFEDSPGGAVGRLLALGVPAVRIVEHLVYLRPDGPFDKPARELLGKILDARRPSLAIVDGVTMAMCALGLDPIRNRDCAEFAADLLGPLTRNGAAVVSVDHLPKDSDARARSALGAITKLTAVSGSSITVELATAFGRGRTGRALLHLSKDRPGYLRPHTTDKVVAVLEMTSAPDGSVSAVLSPPSPSTAATWKPTELMRRVSAVLAKHPAGMNRGQVETSVRGRAVYVRSALDFLVDDGHVEVEKRGNAKIYKHLTPYPPPGGGLGPPPDPEDLP